MQVVLAKIGLLLTVAILLASAICSCQKKPTYSFDTVFAPEDSDREATAKSIALVQASKLENSKKSVYEVCKDNLLESFPVEPIGWSSKPTQGGKTTRVVTLTVQKEGRKKEINWHVDIAAKKVVPFSDVARTCDGFRTLF